MHTLSQFYQSSLDRSLSSEELQKGYAELFQYVFHHKGELSPKQQRTAAATFRNYSSARPTEKFHLDRNEVKRFTMAVADGFSFSDFKHYSNAAILRNMFFEASAVLEGLVAKRHDFITEETLNSMHRNFEISQSERDFDHTHYARSYGMAAATFAKVNGNSAFPVQRAIDKATRHFGDHLNAKTRAWHYNLLAPLLPYCVYNQAIENIFKIAEQQVEIAEYKMIEENLTEFSKEDKFAKSFLSMRNRAEKNLENMRSSPVPKLDH